MKDLKSCDCGCDDDLDSSSDEEDDDEESRTKFTKSLDELLILLKTNKTKISKYLMKSYKEAIISCLK